MIRRYFIISTSAIAMMLLVGCASPVVESNKVNRSQNPDAVLAWKPQFKHMKVQQLGESMKIIMPADVFFIPGTPQLNAEHYAELDELSNYLRSVSKDSISVSAYTDSQGDKVALLVLSRQQASNLVDYLWEQGVDTRVLHAAGYGEDYPVASNTSASQRAMNRRVVISFRKIGTYS